MGGQRIERREILRYIGIASVTGTFPGFKRWAFACPQDHPQPAPSRARSDSYKPPVLFSAGLSDGRTYAEMIIPEDDSPGASQAGVAEFIDSMDANRVPVAELRRGLQRLSAT